MTQDDLPETLAIFPLEGALLLPGGILPLNIFEEKYVRMVDDAMKSQRMIGMIQPDLNARAKGHTGAIVKRGCMGRITQFTETPDNRYFIALQGKCRFRVEKELDTILPYRMVKPEWDAYIDDLVEGCDHIEIDREAFFPLLQKFMDVKNIECSWQMIEQSSCHVLLQTLPMILPFDTMEKQALLEAKTLEDRYKTLFTLLSINVGSETDSKVRH
jgi:Lon protease-like protein